MNLIKTGLWSAVASVIKILISFVLNKILAVHVGPSGIALLGQFSNYSGMLTNFGNGGINSGVIKYIAEYNGDHQRQQKVVNTSLSIAFYCSLLFGCINYILADTLSVYLFNSTEYTIVLKVFSITLIFTSLNSTLLSILNGYKQIKRFIAIGITNNFIGLAMTYFLTVKYHIFGALLSIVLTQSIVCLTTLYIVRRFEWFSISFLKAKFDRVVMINLSKYILMALTSACFVPLSQVMVRNYLSEHLSLEDAGYWQAMWKISEVYLMVITTSLSTYYLPRISELSNKKEIKKELFHCYKIVLPSTMVMAGAIYLLRDYIIPILFTAKFMPMSELFLFQLIGDVVKITSWLLGAFMIAKAMTRLFVVTEIVFSLSFVGLTYLFVNQFGLVGVTYAYAMNYLLHLILMIIVIGKKIFSET